MAENVYECMFILDTTKVAGDVPAAEKQLTGLLEKHKATLLANRPWDERRFAYQIGNQKKGLYYLTYFRTEGKNLVGIEQDCALNEMILRMMILKIDPKWVDPLLALARGEQGAALHNITQDADDGIPEEDYERRPRKRRDD